MRVFTGLHRVFDQVLDAVLVSSCALCDRSTADVCCADCWRQIQHCQLSLTQGIEQISLQPKLSSDPSSEQPKTRLLCWGSYQGSLKRAIATLKQGQQESLGYSLGLELGRLWLKANPKHSSRLGQSTLVVPIPLHPEKLAQRGYNQAELMAAGFCKITGLKSCPSLLERVRSTEAQFRLSAAEREHNLTGAFRVNRTSLRRSPHLNVILIDDIYTTGATIRSAAAALSLHQIPVFGIAAMARPQPYQAF